MQADWKCFLKNIQLEEDISTMNKGETRIFIIKLGLSDSNFEHGFLGDLS